MSYVIYNKETTRKLNSKYFATESAAKAALTRAAKADNTLIKADYAISETGNFYNNIESMVERTNVLSGEKYMERANTPLCCSPSSETYWCS